MRRSADDMKYRVADRLGHSSCMVRSIANPREGVEEKSIPKRQQNDDGA